MFQLIFEQSRLPRTMTRSEWREIDRWRRTCTRKIKESMAERLKYPLTAEDVERIINPPVMIYPKRR